MSHNHIHIQEGQIWHFANILKAGQYGDYFLPMAIKGRALFDTLTAEREEILKDYGDHLEVSTAPFIVDNDRTLIRLKWKQVNIDKGQVVVVDKDNNRLQDLTDNNMQDAILKVSFFQHGWEYLGKTGTKLIPRKIQLLSLATLDNIDVADTFVGGDF
jgi:hypothetical protein